MESGLTFSMQFSKIASNTFETVLDLVRLKGCIENTFKAVQSTFDLKMHSKQRLHKFSQEG